MEESNIEKKKTEFKVKIQNFESQFYFEDDCPLYIAKEAIFQCTKWIGKIEDEVSKENSTSNEVTQLEDTPNEVENVG